MKASEYLHKFVDFCFGCGFYDEYIIPIYMYDRRGNDKSSYSGIPSKIITEFNKQIQWMDFNGENQYCYLVYNKLHGLYKIGITQDYYRRFHQLVNGIGGSLKTILVADIVGSFPDATWLEKFILDYFKNKRINCVGEWLKLTQKDVIEIKWLFEECNCDDVWDEDNPFLIECRGELKQVG